MAVGVTKEEFRALEQEVEGEKLVTRHILEQTRRNGDDLAGVKTRLDRIEQKLDGVDLKGLVHKVDGLDKKVDGLDLKFDGLDKKVGGLDRKVNDLTKNLPKIVGDAMREVLRERDPKG